MLALETPMPQTNCTAEIYICFRLMYLTDCAHDFAEVAVTHWTTMRSFAQVFRLGFMPAFVTKQIGHCEGFSTVQRQFQELIFQRATACKQCGLCSVMVSPDIPRRNGRAKSKPECNGGLRHMWIARSFVVAAFEQVELCQTDGQCMTN
jgi:hypothetical protein